MHGFCGERFSEVALFCSLEYVRVSVCLSHEVPFLHLWLLYLLFLYYTYCSWWYLRAILLLLIPLFSLESKKAVGR